MNKTEKRIIIDICHDIAYSDGSKDSLERLYFAVIKMLK